MMISNGQQGTAPLIVQFSKSPWENNTSVPLTYDLINNFPDEFMIPIASCKPH